MKHYTDEREVREAIHTRWSKNTNRDLTIRPRPDDWVWHQCGVCRYYVALASRLGEDYGACCHADSPMDGRVVFEHDGCDVFEDQDEP
jgi:hypothetical protein